MKCIFILHFRQFSRVNIITIGLIDDDGIGMPQETERQHHYGLSIMKERAHGVSGALCLLPSEMGGTRVELTFSAAGKWQCKDTSQPTPQGDT